MRAPYLALAWTSDAGAACVRGVAAAMAKSGWRLSAEGAGLQLWTREDRPAAVAGLSADEGMIVGHYFGDRALAPVSSGRGPCSAPAAPMQAAQDLSREGWGSYLALLRDLGDGRWWAFRDPSGAVEAYTWRHGPVDILASGLAGLPRGLLPPSVALDWDAIAELLRRPAAQTWHSPLRGIAVVSPGDLHPLGAGGAEARAIWRPAQHVPDRRLRTADPAWPAQLRARARLAVEGLARPYRRLTSEVSGGLDSAIVNAALAEAGLSGRVVEALHYVGDRREGDERAWAAEVCARFGLPFATAQLDPAGFDPAEDFRDLARDLRPPFAALDAARDRDTAARLKASGSDAILTGEGGDAVFYQMPSPKVLADLWTAQGLGALRHPRNAEIARRLRRSVWSVWREAAVPPEALFSLGALAGRRLRGPPMAPAHPWLADLGGVAPGKRLQIEALLGAQISAGPSRIAAASDLLQPLLAQPVMELALSIPSWELARGECDRGLAREAFAPWLPPSITARRSKGALTSFYARQAAASAEALRPYLLDGVLVGTGLLDREAVETALDPDALIRRADGLALISAAALEAWVRHWQTQVPDSPSAPRDRPIGMDV